MGLTLESEWSLGKCFGSGIGFRGFGVEGLTSWVSSSDDKRTAGEVGLECVRLKIQGLIKASYELFSYPSALNPKP